MALYYADTGLLATCCVKRDCCIELASKGPLDILQNPIDFSSVVEEGWGGAQIKWASAQVVDAPESRPTIFVNAEVPPALEACPEINDQTIPGSDFLQIVKISRDPRTSMVDIWTAGGTGGVQYKIDVTIQSCEGHQWSRCFSQYIEKC